MSEGTIQVFGVEVDIDDYIEKLESLHKEAKSEDLPYRDVFERARERFSEKQFEVFQYSLLRGNLSFGNTLDEIAHDARRLKEKQP